MDLGVRHRRCFSFWPQALPILFTARPNSISLVSDCLSRIGMIWFLKCVGSLRSLEPIFFLKILIILIFKYAWNHIVPQEHTLVRHPVWNPYWYYRWKNPARIWNVSNPVHRSKQWDKVSSPTGAGSLPSTALRNDEPRYCWNSY